MERSPVREEACVPRCFKAVAAGVGVGGLAGTVAATWTDVPKVSVTGRTMSAAMGSTLAVVGRSSATFGSVALAFSAVECAAESMREKADVYNGILGGLCAGSVLGIRHNSLPTAVAAGVLMAAGTTLMDVFSDQAKMKATSK